MYIHNTKLLMSCSDDKTMILWNYETPELIHIYTEHIDKVRSLD